MPESWFTNIKIPLIYSALELEGTFHEGTTSWIIVPDFIFL